MYKSRLWMRYAMRTFTIEKRHDGPIVENVWEQEAMYKHSEKNDRDAASFDRSRSVIDKPDSFHVMHTQEARYVQEIEGKRRAAKEERPISVCHNLGIDGVGFLVATRPPACITRAVVTQHLFICAA